MIYDLSITKVKILMAMSATYQFEINTPAGYFFAVSLSHLIKANSLRRPYLRYSQRRNQHGAYADQ